jgi:biotin operon repressor
MRDGELQKKCKWWSKEDEEYLRRHYHSMSSEQVAAALGRTVKMINRKAVHLKITNPNYWSHKETQTLRRLWEQGKTCREIGETLGRTKHAVDHAVARQIRDFGLQRKTKSWSKKDDEYLIRHHGKRSAEQIAIALGRTTQAIRTRAKLLRITDPHSWTDSEIEILKRDYETLSNEQIAEKLGKTRIAVAHKATRLGLKKQDIS